MKGSEAVVQKVYLKDYKPLEYKITHVNLEFDLDPKLTRVTSELEIVCSSKESELFFNGENLKLIDIFVDNNKLEKVNYEVSEKGLTLKNISSEKFILKTICEISPKENSALEGLYLSGDILCTQNEPEGFRRITYFIDRPDNMAVYTVKLIADKTKYPVLLANGNCINQGLLEGGKHWSEWQDPFPKPSYLFALVAGQLGVIKDKFTTKSGRLVDLSIYCDPGQESRCEFAMVSLKNAMKWDEDRFDLEYDLDQYMIVSVGSFNAGAMENKGLNIFNSALVLAEQEMATDMDYLAIESVIGHEYFHNWTGNRVTCRDWFQLTLKEGLTVFRDHEFSSDLNSRYVHRIQEVRKLKEVQFPEDASPMAHPIRPDNYAQINNFYTATVYEKGSEVIRMIHTLVGEAGFQKGMKKYFELYDGKAVTTEDFLNAMKVTNPHFDLELFKNWYSQKGTPSVEIYGKYFEDTKRYEIIYKQDNKSEPNAAPLLIPLKIGFINHEGQEFKPEVESAGQLYWSEGVIALNKKSDTIKFSNVTENPILSLNRSLSAPINLKTESKLEDDLHLLKYDTDHFNRYEMAQKISSDWILAAMENKGLGLNPKIISAFSEIISDETMDMHMKSLLLSAPTESVLHQRQKVIDFENTKSSRDSYLNQMAEAFESQFLGAYESLKSKTKGGFTTEKVGPRALKNQALGYLARLGQTYKELVLEHYRSSDNMSDRLMGLMLINTYFAESAEEINKSFYEKWKKEDLMLQKWIQPQVLDSTENVYTKVYDIKSLPEFDSSVPNYVRSLWGSFSRNFVMFHNPSGQGYKILADEIIEMDGINRSMAAALAKTYRIKTSVSDKNKKLINTELKRIMAKKDISNNLSEVAEQILNS